MRLSLSGLLFILFVSMTMTPRSQAASYNRDQALINAFQTLCTRESPDFKRVDAKAASLQMQRLVDKKTRLPENNATRSRAWVKKALIIGNSMGQPPAIIDPFVVFLTEKSGTKGKKTSCAVISVIPDFDAFRADAVKMMRLPALPSPKTGLYDSRLYAWKPFSGPGTTFSLLELNLKGTFAVMLELRSIEARR